MNGVVWFKTGNVKEAVVVRNVLINSQKLNEYQIEAMVELLVQRMKQL
jgi:hypothetical protein